MTGRQSTTESGEGPGVGVGGEKQNTRALTGHWREGWRRAFKMTQGCHNENRKAGSAFVSPVNSISDMEEDELVTDGHKALWNPRVTSHPLPDALRVGPRSHRQNHPCWSLEVTSWGSDSPGRLQVKVEPHLSCLLPARTHVPTPPGPSPRNLLPQVAALRPPRGWVSRVGGLSGVGAPGR